MIQTVDLHIPVSVGGTVEGSTDRATINSPPFNGTYGYQFTVTLTKLR